MTPWRDWVEAIADGVRRVPDQILVDAAKLLTASSIVLIAGNGGSHALASHAAQALMKPDYAAGGGHPAVCLSDSVPTLTAHANDGGWADAFEALARPFLENATPAFMLFSSSGWSENIVRLARAARGRGCAVVAFTGFDGGALRSLATLSVHVDSRDYEVVEPVHDALLHRLQYHLRELRR